MRRHLRIAAVITAIGLAGGVLVGAASIQGSARDVELGLPDADTPDAQPVGGGGLCYSQDTPYTCADLGGGPNESCELESTTFQGKCLIGGFTEGGYLYEQVFRISYTCTPGTLCHPQPDDLLTFHYWDPA